MVGDGGWNIVLAARRWPKTKNSEQSINDCIVAVETPNVCDMKNNGSET